MYVACVWEGGGNCRLGRVWGGAEQMRTWYVCVCREGSPVHSAPSLLTVSSQRAHLG